MAKVNLDQTRLSHVSESYTLSECRNKPGHEGPFCIELKKLSQQIKKLSLKQSLLKGKR